MNFWALISEFALSFFITISLTLLLEKYLRKLNLLTVDAHKKDKPYVPRPGGPALLAGSLLFLMFIRNLYAFAFASSIVIAFIIGLADDIKKFGGIEKPLLGLLASIPIILFHAYFPMPYLPFVGRVTIKILYPLLILVGYPIYTNAANMIDIFNGVVTGTTAIAILPIILYDLIKGNTTAIYVGIAVEASLIAFYMRHKYPSKIFPGDSGSLLMGAEIIGLMIISRAEILGIISTLPLIFNGFFILSSIKGFKEHSELARPLIVLDDYRMIASKDKGAPVTLARLLASREPKTEKQLVYEIFGLECLASALSIITLVVFYL